MIYKSLSTIMPVTKKYIPSMTALKLKPNPQDTNLNLQMQTNRSHTA